MRGAVSRRLGGRFGSRLRLGRWTRGRFGGRFWGSRAGWSPQGGCIWVGPIFQCERGWRECRG